MQFGYFTLTDTPLAYGTGRRSPQQFLREVLDEALPAEALGFNSVSHANTRRMMERFAHEVMPHFAAQPGGHYARRA